MGRDAKWIGYDRICDQNIICSYFNLSNININMVGYYQSKFTFLQKVLLNSNRKRMATVTQGTSKF
jgi:hypothetical protein